MQFPESLWAIVTVGGPIVLGLALLWALLRNRAQRRGKATTERATRQLYEAEDRARRD